MTLSRNHVRQSILPSGAVLPGNRPGSLHADCIDLAPMSDPGAITTLPYSVHATSLGQLVVASTDIGLCHLAFVSDAEAGRADLTRVFPNAALQLQQDPRHVRAAKLVDDGWDGQGALTLHVPGTSFQFDVWRALLTIPAGTLCTYGQIAAAIGKPAASRAVGTAIGANHAAYLIPCHRVVRGNGDIGGFMWGPERKSALIARETQGLVA